LVPTWSQTWSTPKEDTLPETGRRGVFDPSYALKRRFQRAMIANDESVKEQQNDKQKDKMQDDIFSTEEIVIEEMAIDGICGVY